VRRLFHLGDSVVPPGWDGLLTSVERLKHYNKWIKALLSKGLIMLDFSFVQARFSQQVNVCIKITIFVVAIVLSKLALFLYLICHQAMAVYY
jgi:hypothetical protein